MQQVEKKWYNKWWGILTIVLLMIIIAFFIAFSLHVYNIIKSGQLNGYVLPKILDEKTLATIEGSKKMYWIGSANPKITIVEFSDFACPYCKKSFSKIREISLKYKNNVKIIYRDYPTISEYSIDLALAARCAGEQGLFWVMHDKLFLNQGISQKEEIMELANQIGADIEKFESCFNRKKYLSAIQKDFADGKELGITGTPTWFINGNKIKGDIPYTIFTQLMEQQIKK